MQVRRLGSHPAPARDPAAIPMGFPAAPPAVHFSPVGRIALKPSRRHGIRSAAINPDLSIFLNQLTADVSDHGDATHVKTTDFSGPQPEIPKGKLSKHAVTSFETVLTKLGQKMTRISAHFGGWPRTPPPRALSAGLLRKKRNQAATNPQAAICADAVQTGSGDCWWQCSQADRRHVARNQQR